MKTANFPGKKWLRQQVALRNLLKRLEETPATEKSRINFLKGEIKNLEGNINPSALAVRTKKRGNRKTKVGLF